MGLASLLRAILFLFVLTLDFSCGYDINNDHLHFVDYFGFTGKHEGRLQLNVTNIRFSTSPVPLNSSSLSQIGFFFHPRTFSTRLIQLPPSCFLHSPMSKTIFTFDHIQQPPSINLIYSVTDDEIYDLYFQNCLPTEFNVSMSIQYSMYNLDGRTGRRWYLSAHMYPLLWIYTLFLFAYSSFACTWKYFLIQYKTTVIRDQVFLLLVVILKAVSIILELSRLTLISHTGCAECSTSLWLTFLSRFLNATPLMAWVILVIRGSSGKKQTLTLWKLEIFLVIFVILGQAYLTYYGMFWMKNGDPASNRYEEATYYCTYNYVFYNVVLIVAGIAAIRFFKVSVNAHGKGYESLKMFKRIRSVSLLFLIYNMWISLITLVLESVPRTPKTIWLSVMLKESATLMFLVFIWFKYRPRISIPVTVTEEVEKAALVSLRNQLEHICIVA